MLESGLRSFSPYCHHAAAANAVIQTDAAIQSSGLKERDFVGRGTTKLGASIGAACAVSLLAGDQDTEPCKMLWQDGRSIAEALLEL